VGIISQLLRCIAAKRCSKLSLLTEIYPVAGPWIDYNIFFHSCNVEFQLTI
jgi:hypothetical protein